MTIGLARRITGPYKWGMLDIDAAMESEFAAHAARVARQDAVEGRPGYHRNASNAPAWRDGYDAGRAAVEAE